MPDEIKPAAITEAVIPPAAVEQKTEAKVEAKAPEVKVEAKAETKTEAKTEVVAPEKTGSMLADEKVDAKTEKTDEPKKTGEAAPIALVIPKDSGLTQANLDEVLALAKDKGLSQAQAQSLLDRDAKIAASNKAAYVKTFDSWKAESVKQYGDKLGEMTENAKRFLRSDAVTDAERALVRDTPYGNHPFMIKLLAKLGESLREDAAPTGTQAPPKAKSLVDRFYPKGQQPSTAR